jgi:phospholipid transport system substrate-binding protein
MFRRSLLAGAVAVALGLLAAAPRVEAAADPRAFVGDLGTRGIQMLGPSVPQARRAAMFGQIFQSDFDIPGISRFVVGRYWRDFTPAQQQEFLRLFQEATAQTYAKKLSDVGGGQFRVIDVREVGDETVVGSEAVGAGGKPVHMDWHVAGRDGGLKVTDVFVDGVSMKVSQREEFASIIQKNGGQPQALLAVLRQEVRTQAGAERPH